MMNRPFLLVNTNTLRPPVSPVGLEYVGESLVEAGIPVRVLELAFVADWEKALGGEIEISEPLGIGLAVRNSDDSSFATRQSFLPWITRVVAEVRRHTRAPVVLGGAGFSIMPEVALKVTGADAGIAGDGEEALPMLVRCLAEGKDFSHLPNVVYFHSGSIISSPRSYVNLGSLPVPRRRLFDNRRYERAGAMVGVETKRGCSQRCIFCADPVARGNTVRLRPPEIVVREFRDLLDQGVSWFHLCDSEFNLPLDHAKEVCRALIGAGIGDRMRWYTYCSPTPFDSELAGLMRRAGCAGINFGVDSLCDDQLIRLGRAHTVADVRGLAHLLGRVGLNFMFDLLLGAPGETRETVRVTLDMVREMDVPLAGIACGVRVYAGSTLAHAVNCGFIKEGLYSPGEGEPVYYLSPLLGEDAPAFIDGLVGGDPRFLSLLSPSQEGSYNYAGDEHLCRLIEGGERGAYWDILRRSRTS